MNSLWNIKLEDLDFDEINALSNELQLNKLTAALLWNRGCKTPSLAREFLVCDKLSLHNPFLMKDMDKAANQIKSAIDTGKKIAVYGDYDVDGVTSTCIVYTYLKSRKCDVAYHIPHRFEEGYGLNKKAIDDLAAENTELIITVDCGITAVEEIEYIKTLGIKTIVTDHHKCPDRLPDCEAVVNPHRTDCDYPTKELCGAGVAFNLICAVESLYHTDLSISDIMDKMSDEYSDLVAIGTIADVMDLKGFNRYIVKQGITSIENSKRYGIRALKELSEYKVNSTYISFNIAPKLNAAGRIDRASIALELLLADNTNDAAEGVKKLLELNKLRQEEETKIYKSAVEMISADKSYNDDEILVLAGENWHSGVIGIVASRILERYKKPTVMISVTDNDSCRGSGRSMKGLNLVEAVNSCRDILSACGGHELAAGLSIEKSKIPEFRRAINEYAKDNIDYSTYTPKIDVECKIKASDITIEAINDISRLEPYGQGNPVPLFVLTNVKINAVTGVGQDKHTRLTIEGDKKIFNAIYFGVPPQNIKFSNGDIVDILCSLDINEYRGEISPKIMVKGITEASSIGYDKKRQSELYEKIKSGEKFSSNEKAIPERKDFAVVYRELVRLSKIKQYDISENYLIGLLHYEKNSLCKIRFIFDILSEVGLVDNKLENEFYSFSLLKTQGKVNLDKSPLYNMIRSNKI